MVAGEGQLPKIKKLVTKKRTHIHAHTHTLTHMYADMHAKAVLFRDGLFAF